MPHLIFIAYTTKMNSRLNKSWLLLLPLILMSACQNLSPLKKNSWEQHHINVAQISQWQIKGKIGVIYTVAGKKKALSARTHWRQNRAQYLIDLYGPLGLGHYKIERQDKITVVTNPHGNRFSSNSAETLLYRHTGMNLPIEQLKFWIKGIPAPGQAYTHTTNEQALLSSLSQDNWAIQYISYQESSQGTGQNRDMISMPKKIKLTNGDVKVTLLINDWRYNKQAI